MRFRNNLGVAVNFPYAGVHHGRVVASGALSQDIPVSRLDHQVMKRDLADQRITVVFDSADVALLGPARVGAIVAMQEAAKEAVTRRLAGSAADRAAKAARARARVDEHGALRMRSPLPVIPSPDPIGLPPLPTSDAAVSAPVAVATRVLAVREIGQSAAVDFGDPADWTPGRIPTNATLSQLYAKTNSPPQDRGAVKSPKSAHAESSG